MCGHPLSGKTVRTQQLVKYLTEEAKVPVKLVSLETLGIGRNGMYRDVQSEKRGHSALLSAAEKDLSKETVVILDWLNHIKGFRYELYCKARTASTSHCVVYCESTPEQVREANAREDEKTRYEDKILEDLLRRLEIPNEKNRWDSPLFTIKDEKEEMPCQQIADALLKGKSHVASFATAVKAEESATLLYDLDRVTQEIMRAVLAAQQAGSGPGDVVRVPHTPKLVTLTRRLGLPELRRLQQQFLKVARVRSLSKAEETAAAFVDYLNTSASVV